MVIHDSDCDIDFLKEADFIDESIETRSYVMAQARLSVISVYTKHGNQNYPDLLSIENMYDLFQSISTIDQPLFGYRVYI